jgi:hypothetical protein
MMYLAIALVETVADDLEYIVSRYCGVTGWGQGRDSGRQEDGPLGVSLESDKLHVVSDLY